MHSRHRWQPGLWWLRPSHKECAPGTSEQGHCLLRRDGVAKPCNHPHRTVQRPDTRGPCRRSAGPAWRRDLVNSRCPHCPQRPLAQPGGAAPRLKGLRGSEETWPVHKELSASTRDAGGARPRSRLPSLTVRTADRSRLGDTPCPPSHCPASCHSRQQQASGNSQPREA